MKLEKAIEISHSIVDAGDYRGDPDDSTAIKLGIEAIAKIVKYRRDLDPQWHELLPSETKE